MDEGRKRVLGIMAAILASLHMQTADDLFGTPQGSPRTDKIIDASIQWAERIMKKIDDRFRGDARSRTTLLAYVAFFITNFGLCLWLSQLSSTFSSGSDMSAREVAEV
jgi:hypothetical protein